MLCLHKLHHLPTSHCCNPVEHLLTAPNSVYFTRNIPYNIQCTCTELGLFSQAAPQQPHAQQNLYYCSQRFTYALVHAHEASLRHNLYQTLPGGTLFLTLHHPNTTPYWLYTCEEHLLTQDTREMLTQPAVRCFAIKLGVRIYAVDHCNAIVL